MGPGAMGGERKKLWGPEVKTGKRYVETSHEREEAQKGDHGKIICIIR